MLGTRRVRADRRGIDQRRDLRCRGGLEHPPAALDVHLMQPLMLASRLEQPSEVNHRVRTMQKWDEIMQRDVGLNESGAWHHDLRFTSRNCEDLGHGWLT